MPGRPKTKGDLIEELIWLKTNMHEEIKRSLATITRIQEKLELLRQEISDVRLVPLPPPELTYQQEDLIIEEGIEKMREEKAANEES